MRSNPNDDKNNQPQQPQPQIHQSYPHPAPNPSNPETITIHCELHPDIDDPTNNWTESDPQSTIKTGSTLRGLDPFKHTPKRILEAWSKHQNHPDQEWELLLEGHSIDSAPLPPNETLRNLGIRDGDRFWVRSSISGSRSSSSHYGMQPAPAPAAISTRFDQERSLRPAPHSSGSPHVFPGPLDTSRALSAVMNAAGGLNGSISNNDGTTPANSSGSASTFALNPSTGDGNASPTASLNYQQPPPAAAASSGSHHASSATHPQRDSSNFSSAMHSNDSSSGSQKHPRASSPGQDADPSTSYHSSSYNEGSSKRRRPSPLDRNNSSFGFSNSNSGSGSMDPGNFSGPSNPSTSVPPFSRTTSSTGAAASKSESPAPNKTTAKIQRYESSISDLWGGDGWQNEVLMPGFAPVSKGKDAVRAVQQLAKLTPGEGGPGGTYPARVKSAIVNAMQSRISRNKLASQKTTIPDLQEAFSLLKGMNEGEAQAAEENPQQEYQNPQGQNPEYYNQQQEQQQQQQHPNQAQDEGYNYDAESNDQLA